jgi:uncharacterized protein (UPF0261 family)
MAHPTILIIGTCDTKLDEILYLREQIHRSSSECATLILDASHTNNNVQRYRDWSDEILAPCLLHTKELSSLPRGRYIDKAIALCLPVVKDLVDKGKVQGLVSAGGSTGSSLACALMQTCPIGLPKLMVSTMASGDIKPYIGESDITMMYSVVDIAGLNSILKRILSNAASAIAAMSASYAASLATSPSTTGPARRVGITMFGVTTPLVDHIRRLLAGPPFGEESMEVYVFHATGSGGRAMERLVKEGQLDAVLDLTTTEIADELFDGVLSAGSDRMEAAAKKGIPNIVSVGGKHTLHSICKLCRD